jgi:hypothetical protein
MLLFPDGPPLRPIRFAVEAFAEPGLLARLLAPFTRRAIDPDTMQVRRHGAKLHALFAVDEMPAEMIHLVEGNLRQVIGVVRITVETYVIRRPGPESVSESVPEGVPEAAQAA